MKLISYIGFSSGRRVGRLPKAPSAASMSKTVSASESFGRHRSKLLWSTARGNYRDALRDSADCLRGLLVSHNFLRNSSYGRSRWDDTCSSEMDSEGSRCFLKRTPHSSALPQNTLFLFLGLRLKDLAMRESIFKTDRRHRKRARGFQIPWTACKVWQSPRCQLWSADNNLHYNVHILVEHCMMNQ